MNDQALPDMPEAGQPTRITFVGMHTESHADIFRLGDPHLFKVAGRIVAVGEEQMADGHRRNVVKVDVGEISPLSYDEPPTPDAADGPEDLD